MNIGKTKAERVSEYFSRQLKNPDTKNKHTFNPRKYKDELKSERTNKSSNQKESPVNQQFNVMVDVNSSYSKQNDTTHGSMVSCQSPIPKIETDPNSEVKVPKLETKPNHGKQKISPMPPKMPDNSQGSFNPYYGAPMNYMMDYNPYSQGSYNFKQEPDRMSPQNNPYANFMRHPMNVHSQMMSHAYANGYPMPHMHPQLSLSQQMDRE